MCSFFVMSIEVEIDVRVKVGEDKFSLVRGHVEKTNFHVLS